MPYHRQPGVRFAAVLVCFLLMVSVRASGSVSLLVEEPFGTWGTFNPTGHAALYLDHVCADTPTSLRLCRSGEAGVVISRYHRVHGYDWVAVPLIPYLYAVENLSQVPESATARVEAELRDTYRRDHLLDIAPDTAGGKTPGGEWVELVGSAYDRQIYGFELPTTPAQDGLIVATLNDSRNHGRFNFFSSNCADFSRVILHTIYPEFKPRRAISDFGVTTPKHLALSVTKFGEHTPGLQLRRFRIPQVPGSIGRSHGIRGGGESLVRSKKYMLPLLLASPTTAAGLLVAYLGTGRFPMPKDAPLMEQLQPQTLGVVMSEDDSSSSGAAEAAGEEKPDIAEVNEPVADPDIETPVAGGGSQ